MSNIDNPQAKGNKSFLASNWRKPLLFFAIGAGLLLYQRYNLSSLVFGSAKSKNNRIEQLENRIREFESKTTGPEYSYSPDRIDQALQASQELEELERIEGNAEFGFLHMDYHFGNVRAGSMVEHTFEFINNGEEDLIISKVVAACGCTSPEYSSKPILPGNGGFVRVVLDTSEKFGNTSAFVTVNANTKTGPVKLMMEGFVSP